MASDEHELTGTERRARAAFDASVESLDASSRARLVAARRAAVDSTRRPGRAPWRIWAPAAVMASAALVAVLLWHAQAPESPGTADLVATDAALDPVELLAAGEDLDLVENDLAFYEWLDSTEFETGGSSG